MAAWNKYGPDVFKFSVIELCDESELSIKECEYIQKYHTMSHEYGYNLTPGGENVSNGRAVLRLKDKKRYNYVHEAATDANVTVTTMSAWCKTKHNYMYMDEYESLNSKEKLYWENFDWTEFDHKKLSKAHSRANLSPETLQRVSESLSGSRNPRAIKVYCPQLDETFEYIKEAKEKYGICPSSITSYLKGKLKSAGTHPVTGEKLTWQRIEE